VGLRRRRVAGTSDLFAQPGPLSFPFPLAVRIGHELPLTQAAEAHRELEGRRTTGKVLLIP